jgi:ankyrin repeat protein
MMLRSSNNTLRERPTEKQLVAHILNLVAWPATENRTIPGKFEILKGNTALHIAASLEHLDLVKQLVQAGADVNVVNEKHSTPLIRLLFIPYKSQNSFSRMVQTFTTQTTMEIQRSHLR